MKKQKTKVALISILLVILLSVAIVFYFENVTTVNHLNIGALALLSLDNEKSTECKLMTTSKLRLSDGSLIATGFPKKEIILNELALIKSETRSEIDKIQVGIAVKCSSENITNPFDNFQIKDTEGYYITVRGVILWNIDVIDRNGKVVNVYSQPSIIDLLVPANRVLWYGTAPKYFDGEKINSVLGDEVGIRGSELIVTANSKLQISIWNGFPTQDVLVREYPVKEFKLTSVKNILVTEGQSRPIGDFNKRTVITQPSSNVIYDVADVNDMKKITNEDGSKSTVFANHPPTIRVFAQLENFGENEPPPKVRLTPTFAQSGSQHPTSLGLVMEEQDSTPLYNWTEFRLTFQFPRSEASAVYLIEVYSEDPTRDSATTTVVTRNTRLQDPLPENFVKSELYTIPFVFEEEVNDDEIVVLPPTIEGNIDKINEIIETEYDELRLDIPHLPINNISVDEIDDLDIGLIIVFVVIVITIIVILRRKK